eukprot:CAMPEP_0202956788 /NCGR_PEP_ID=MMETSP1396-20130829/1281_1 /ASSEMBLY_ACC=CAM_ASM_000872 /TAXON_ID= /ORGANISM="Pseudokeronopsis sp., Strain Brazil" /LENGTH=161 /DNA_ID=CAMNT_0049673967 /DNA_START=39 /DNA_END=524 /DNA_ORIENTATION=-
MGDINDYDFSGTDAGASHVYNEEAGQIRVGGYICIKDHPCKVSAVSTSKTGKHGHAKCNFTAIDIFTGKKYEDIIPSTHNTSVPFVKRAEYSLVDISSDGFTSLMDEQGNMREDVRLPDFPENFAREIQGAFDGGKELKVIVVSAMGHDQIVEMKEEAEKK